MDEIVNRFSVIASEDIYIYILWNDGILLIDRVERTFEK